MYEPLTTKYGIVIDTLHNQRHGDVTAIYLHCHHGRALSSGRCQACQRQPWRRGNAGATDTVSVLLRIPEGENVVTLECLINVPVHLFISKKMPAYTGLIWHYTFIKFMRLYWPDHFLEKQSLHQYLYNVSLGTLLEGDTLECCLFTQAAGTGSDCSSSQFAYNLCDLLP